MKKVLKIAAIIAGGLVMIAIAGVIIIPLIVEPNDYKDEITESVRKASGRDLTINGDIELSVFPWLGLNIGQLTSANPPNFGEGYMARAEQAEVRLQLIPLLFDKQLVMKTVVLRGLEVNLIKNQDGSANWENIGGEPDEKPDEKPDNKEEPSEPGKEEEIRKILAGLDISGVEITDAQVTMNDHTQGTSVRISDLNLIAGRFKIGEPCPLDLQLRLDSAKPVISTDIALETEMTLTFSEQHADMADTQLTLTIHKMNPEAENQNREISGSANLSAGIALNWGASRLKIDGLNLQSDIRGGLLPAGKSELALKAAGVDVNWGTSSSLSLTEVDAVLDQATIGGDLSVKNFRQPDIRFDLNIGEIDMNRYLPAPEKKPEPGKSSEKSEKEPFLMPRVNGNLRAAGIKIRDMQFSDLRLRISGKDGRVRFKPIPGAKKTGTVSAENPFVIDLQFNLDSAKPLIKTGVDLKTEAALFLSQGQAALDRTRLALTLDPFNPDPKNKKTALSGTASLAANMQVNWKESRLRAEALDLKSKIRGGQIPGGETDLSLKGNLFSDWEKGHLTVSNMNLAAYDMHITGDANADHLFSDPRIRGSFNFAEFSPKQLMKTLGAPPPETTDPNALSKVSGAFRVAASKNAVNISKLRAKIDRTTLRGNANMASFKPLSVKFDLTADEIAIDRYLPPSPPGKKNQPPGKKPDEKKIPVETLKETDINGTLRISKLRAHKAEVSDMRLSIVAKEGIVRIRPLSANIFNGKLRTTLLADMGKETPRTNMSISLTDADMGTFIQKIFGKNFITGGRSNLSLILNSRGDTLLANLKTLSGSAGLNTSKAVLKDYNIPGLIALSGYPVENLLKKFGVRKNEPLRTDIDAINARFDIQSGKLMTKGFTLKTPKDRVTVKGSVNLLDQMIDCKVMIDMEDIASIPLFIKGPLQAPNIRPDVSGIVTHALEKIIKIPPNIGEKMIRDPEKTVREIIKNPLNTDFFKGFGIGGKKEEKKE